MSPAEIVVRPLLVWVLFRLTGRKELSRRSTFDFAVVLLVTRTLARSR